MSRSATITGLEATVEALRAENAASRQLMESLYTKRAEANADLVLQNEILRMALLAMSETVVKLRIEREGT